MLQVVPNSGILGDDSLDRLRGDAIFAAQDGLPEPVVYYLRAIERRYLDMQRDERRRSLSEVNWKFVKVGTTPQAERASSREEQP